jgi:peptide/nickel transport system substrate-binding protein
MYKKVRFYFRFLVAFVRKYLLIILFGMLLSLAFSFLLPRLLILIPKSHEVIRVGIIGQYTLDALPRPILDQISLGLTSISASGSALPGLAEKWDISPDGKIFIFTLKPDQKWQDGQALKSQDFQYQLRDAKITFPDSRQIRIELREPFAPLPVFLSHPILRLIPNRLFSPIKLYGVGNYKITNLKINGNQINFLEIQAVRPELTPQIFKYYFYPSVSQAVTAFKLGLLDRLDGLNSAEDMTEWPNVQILTSVLTNRYLGIFFNTQNASFSGQSGKILRMALAYAVNKKSFNNNAWGPLNPKSWAYNSDVKKYDFDLVKAADLLKKVEVIPKSVNLSTLPNYLSLAQSVKSDWEKLGLQVNVSVSPGIPQDFQVLLVAQAIPADPDQYNLWHSTQDSTNLTNLNNPRIDKLLEDGRRIYDPAERKKIYADFQKYLVDEVPAIFLYYPDSYSLIKK